MPTKTAAAPNSTPASPCRAPRSAACSCCWKKPSSSARLTEQALRGSPVIQRPEAALCWRHEPPVAPPDLTRSARHRAA
ncbi:hypothetical protein G6F31_012905 [Rhizopus arrhizus]|nr:hypothetical protein G6F31_012905 [Rhizopus arrhizus]